MGDNALLLGMLAALLFGLAAGKAWERYKLRDGRWIDRRRFRDSPHYLQGLNRLVDRQIDPAIESFSRAAANHEEAVDVQVVLGNLYREKGQVSRAIQVHQQILQRPSLSKTEHRHVLLCLGLDFKRAGFVDRAVEAFTEVLQLDADNRDALANLEELHEDQHNWAEAYQIRQRLAALAPAEAQARHQTILAFLENALGEQALARQDRAEAERRFEAAIDRDPGTVPAYLHLGDLYFAAGQVDAAVRTWERAIEVSPDRAYLVFDRLSSAYATERADDQFPALCRRLVAENAQDWRARLALAQHLGGRGRPADALPLLFDALAVNPHAISLHQAAWHTLSELGLDPTLVARYVEVSRQAVFYQDPHLCLRCHYRSTELLWQCPHCHDWNSFVEERLTPALEEGDLPGAGRS
jgi:lipopolysaccharide assembly protein B